MPDRAMTLSSQIMNKSTIKPRQIKPQMVRIPRIPEGSGGNSMDSGVGSADISGV
jgi:hypothetical protein